MSHPEIIEIPPAVLEAYDLYRRAHIEKVIASARAQIEALHLDLIPELELALIEEIQDSIRAESDFMFTHGGRTPRDTVN